MTDSVQIREMQMTGRRVLRYVLASDIPPEIRKRFEQDVVPCACPNITAEQDYFAYDWERWRASNPA